MADQLANTPNEERVLMAPRWMYDLAEIDAIDATLGTVGTLSAYAIGGVPGIVAWGGIFTGITIIRKTPLIPWTIRTIVEWRARPDIVNGRFRDTVFPSFREDAQEVVVHPQQREAESVERGAEHPKKRGVLSQKRTGMTSVVSRKNRDREAVIVEHQTSGRERPSTLIIPARDHAPPSTGSVRAWVQQYRSLCKLPALHGRHIVIFGPTGIGKSTIIKWLLRQRQDGTLIIADPHYKPGNWPGRAYLVGKGRNFGETAETIDFVIEEMSRRYQQAADGELDLDQVKPVYLVIDEMSALAEQEPDAVKKLLTIAQEGRKAKIYVILTPHGQNVKTMGLEGRGDARANFAFIEGQPVPDTFKHFPRIVTVTLGPPKEKGSQQLGRFVIPAPQTYTAAPHFGLPKWLKQGVPCDDAQDKPGVWLERVSDNKKTVSQSVSGSDKYSVSSDRYGSGTGFAQRFSSDSVEVRKLSGYIANHGYGIRKISRFLPFASSDAQALARDILSEIKQMPARPVAGSEAEYEMVRYLHGDCGAPLERIAKLLNGNTWENLARIKAYIN